jgi:hypothetical protein
MKVSDKGSSDGRIHGSDPAEISGLNTWHLKNKCYTEYSNPSAYLAAG